MYVMGEYLGVDEYVCVRLVNIAADLCVTRMPHPGVEVTVQQRVPLAIGTVCS